MGYGKEGGGEEREGNTGGEGQGQEGRAPPNILLHPPSSSFLEICLLATADRLSSFVLCCKNFGYQEH